MDILNFVSGNLSQLGLLQNFVTEAILIAIFSIIALVTNRKRLAEFLGFRNTQIDIPFDHETGRVMLVKTVPNKEGQVPVWVFPQCRARATETWEQTSERNCAELGLGANHYKAKVFLVNVGASTVSKKSYAVVKVKISAQVLIRSRVWTPRDIGAQTFRIESSVEYSAAKFVSPEEALRILKADMKKGKENKKRYEAYELAIKML